MLSRWFRSSYGQKDLTGAGEHQDTARNSASSSRGVARFGVLKVQPEGGANRTGPPSWPGHAFTAPLAGLFRENAGTWPVKFGGRLVRGFIEQPVHSLAQRWRLGLFGFRLRKIVRRWGLVPGLQIELE